MKLIEKAVAHFSAKEIRSLYIPEWECTVYAKNMTLEDKATWYKRAQGDTHQFLLYAVLFGLQDENGNACFDLGDKPKLEKGVDPDIVDRLAGFVMNTAAKSDEEREKN